MRGERIGDRVEIAHGARAGVDHGQLSVVRAVDQMVSVPRQARPDGAATRPEPMPIDEPRPSVPSAQNVDRRRAGARARMRVGKPECERAGPPEPRNAAPTNWGYSATSTETGQPHSDHDVILGTCRVHVGQARKCDPCELERGRDGRGDGWTPDNPSRGQCDITRSSSTTRSAISCKCNRPDGLCVVAWRRRVVDEEFLVSAATYALALTDRRASIGDVP